MLRSAFLAALPLYRCMAAFATGIVDAPGHGVPVPRLPGHDGGTCRIVALHPDLVVEYGTGSSRYAGPARTTQPRTGVPTMLLDDAPEQIPQAFRLLGHALHWKSRARAQADFAAGLLNLLAGVHRLRP